MNKKRKDSKGRVLNQGENQRKNGTYQYRYTTPEGKRAIVYAATLNELREKEADIQAALDDKLDYNASRSTALELVEQFLGLKRGIREQTKEGYYFVLKKHLSDRLFKMQIGNIRITDAKRFFIRLEQKGYSYSTMVQIKTVLRQAFQEAVEDDIISKNPFLFQLSSVISSGKKTRFALTVEQQKLWLDFIKNDDHYAKYYDQYVILLGTGLRVSEFCGLTLNNLDFKNRRILVDHQLLQTKSGYKIEKNKTENGVRYLPMSDAVYESFQSILRDGLVAKNKFRVDGYTGFVFLNSSGNPETKDTVGKRTRRILNKYNSQHDKQMPNITPHILRHTFCSNMANGGISPNHLKYFMGHSKVSTTLDVYTHSDYKLAALRMIEISNSLAS